jgi:hypothetical protein
MAKKKSRSGNGARPGGARPSAPPPGPSPLTQLQSLHTEALAGAHEGDREAIAVETPLQPGADAVQCWKIANEAKSLLDSQKKRLEDAERRADAARSDAERKQRENAAVRVQLDEERRKALAESEELKEQRRALEERIASLEQRETSLLERETNAAAGFAAQRHASLQELREEIDRANRELSDVRRQISEERAAWRVEQGQAHAAQQARLDELWAKGLEKLQDEKTHLRRDIDEQRQAFEAERKKLESDKAAIVAAREELATERELLEIGRRSQDARVERLAAERVQQGEGDLARSQAQLGRARSEVERLHRRLEEREEADRRFGHRSPEDVLAELERTRAEIDELRDALALRPGPESIERLEELERQRTTWEAERARLHQTNRQLEADLARRLVGVTEVESLRDQVRVLEAYRDVVQQRVSDLRSEVDSLTSAGHAVQVFPACAAMDADQALQAHPELHEEIDLARFVNDLRHWIATDPETPDPLFYSERDLRIMVAGLAMSRLHVLQGISGTGKTSLPLAFARAVEAGSTLVEVQAGWRSEEDLFGHYNAFEHRYYESEFLRALYLAQTPAYRNRPYIVVLDEMNLSHPEHYAATILAAIEKTIPHERTIKLLSAPAPNVPRNLIDGRMILLPENVWIIGTANHDETTREFADKTYDRAHIMELPRQRSGFTPKTRPKPDPLAYMALEDAFSAARERFEAECRSKYGAFESVFGGELEKFDIGWGNRLERQMLRFYPVVRAAGGTAGEAIDHLLATKLLRKLRDRHGIEPDALRRLRDVIVDEWSRIDSESLPEQSVALLTDELRAKGAEA